MEVGPLARYVVAYASGHEEITEQINTVLRVLDVPVTALFSTLGRTAARGIETLYCADLQLQKTGELADAEDLLEQAHGGDVLVRCWGRATVEHTAMGPNTTYPCEPVESTEGPDQGRSRRPSPEHPCRVPPGGTS